MKKLGFGLMRLPYSESEEWGHVDLEKTKEMIDAYMAQGFSYFDTAWVYHGGFSEKIFGELVAKRYPREKFQVVSKMPVWELKEEGDSIGTRSYTGVSGGYTKKYLRALVVMKQKTKS